MKRKILLLVLPVLLLLPGLLWSPAAMSQPYAGIALGVSGVTEETSAAEVDDQVLSGLFYAGTRLSPYTALEIAYLRLAALDYDQRTGNISLNADLDFHAWIPSISLRWGADRASVFSSVGVAFWEAELDLENIVRIDDQQSDLAFSIGVDLQPMGGWNLRAQWITFGADLSAFANTNVNTLLLGAHYRF